jgi:hypothetical protein
MCVCLVYTVMQMQQRCGWKSLGGPDATTRPFLQLLLNCSLARSKIVKYPPKPPPCLSCICRCSSPFTPQSAGSKLRYGLAAECVYVCVCVWVCVSVSPKVTPLFSVEGETRRAAKKCLGFLIPHDKNMLSMQTHAHTCICTRILKRCGATECRRRRTGG